MGTSWGLNGLLRMCSRGESFAVSTRGYTLSHSSHSLRHSDPAMGTPWRYNGLLRDPSPHPEGTPEEEGAAPKGQPFHHSDRSVLAEHLRDGGGVGGRYRNPGLLT